MRAWALALCVGAPALGWAQAAPTAPAVATPPCDLACAQARLNALRAQRAADPTGRQINDQLTFTPTPAAAPGAAPASTAPAPGRLQGLLRPGAPAAPPPAPPQTAAQRARMQQLLKRAAERRAQPGATPPSPFNAPAARTPPAPRPAAATRPPPPGDAGGPQDRAACGRRDAEACNRVGRVYWDRLKPPAHDPQQLDTLKAAQQWYGKACDAGKETACWEAIGLLQRVQKTRPTPWML